MKTTSNCDGYEMINNKIKGQIMIYYDTKKAIQFKCKDYFVYPSKFV